ncbi:hypothetical protein DUNSADRAFT_1397 [Dunaliella salina]|uniref:Uncharacterized protein n=1 Tax=Dunaliella salina TaxID=3046 RepID=A0ABQ7GX38_DUNSA|nr:hypothetical protein DUNSADRAFT_1397 [Dunaliella salina]|eukprot:KAF5839170.1 hypothetical protein DUNSADRAFT_1397 [Dunaliella salina]
MYPALGMSTSFASNREAELLRVAPSKQLLLTAIVLHDHIHSDSCMLTFMRAHSHACSQSCVLTVMRAHIMHAHIHACSQSCMLTFIRAHSHVCSHSCMLTVMHAHSHACSQSCMLTVMRAHSHACSQSCVLTMDIAFWPICVLPSWAVCCWILASGGTLYLGSERACAVCVKASSSDVSKAQILAGRQRKKQQC